MRWLLALVAACTYAPARVEPPPDAPAGPQGVTAFLGTDPDLAPGDLAPLDALIGDARVIGLGDSVHGSGGYSAFKRRMIEHLVLDGDVRAIALESPRTAARTLDAYVQSDCSGDPVAAVKAVDPVLADDNLLALVVWTCGFNHDHPTDRVRVFGIDMQQPVDDLAEIEAVAPSIDLSACLATPDLAASYGATAYAACSQALDAVDVAVAGTPAALAALSFRAWQDMVFYLNADPVRSIEARDSAMASIFVALDPSVRTVVWAGDAHLMRAHAQVSGDPVAGATTMGTTLAGALGDDYAPIALVAYDLAIDVPGETVRPALLGSIASDLHALGEPALIVEPAAYAPGPRVLRDGATLGDGRFVLADQFRALVYLDRSPAMTALFW